MRTKITDSVIGRFVIELVADVKFDVGVLTQHVEGDEQQEGVDVGSVFGQLQVDVDPHGCEDAHEHQDHVGGDVYFRGVEIGEVVHFGVDPAVEVLQHEGGKEIADVQLIELLGGKVDGIVQGR